MKPRHLHFAKFLLMVALLAAGCAPVPAAAPLVPTPTQTEIPTAVSDTPAALPAVLPTETASPEAEAVLAAEIPQNLPLRYEIVAELSEARYRVREQLASLSFPNDAVGVTKQISGSVTLLPDGTIDSAVSEFVVNLASLQTDSDRRDNFVRRNLLQTDRYPTAVFVPNRVSGLSYPLPDSGEVSFDLIGDMTIRDVTREVTWTVSGTIQDGQAVGQAVIRLTFEDFNLTKPSVASVLSIEDHIDLEVDAVIRPASGQ
jgi:polyisoprenoid-binding protein YceI